MMVSANFLMVVVLVLFSCLGLAVNVVLKLNRQVDKLELELLERDLVGSCDPIVINKRKFKK